MLFSEENAPLLKKWIVKRLENTSDADADVLADYVLALLRHDGDTETVRQLCEREIPDFLKEDSSIFVRDVFDAIHYKSYIPGSLPPRKPSIPFAPPSGPSAPSYGKLGVDIPSASHNGSRKRSFHERSDGDSQDRALYPGGDPNNRMYKQPRRGFGRGNLDNFSTGRGGYSTNRLPPANLQGGSPLGFPIAPAMPSPPPGMPPFDPNNPLAAVLAMQAMGFPIPGVPPFLQPNPQTGPTPGPTLTTRKQRCRDYDIKGFCARGNTCQFEHGEHSIWVPPANEGDEYDPTNSSLMTGIEINDSPVDPNRSNPPRGSDRGRGRGGYQGGGGQFNYSNRRGGRSEFSSDRPNYDKSNTMIVVENIPEEKFSEDEVREFFSEFGGILEVSMRPYKRLAIVKFDNWNSAKVAYNSPKVIFDNRFVKVYWYVNQESLPQPPAVSTSNGGPKIDASLTSTTPKSSRETSEPKLDLEEFTRKQQEAQKAHEEKMKRKQEMETAKKELEKRQEELLKNQAEEKRKLLKKIAAKSGKSASPSTGSATLATEGTKSASQTETLKAQLAALEAEAQSLGIDYSVPDDASWGGRGRGRGRGGYRGRGPYTPLGYRGYRGRGAAPFQVTGRSFNLDNRPKKIALTGIDFSDPEKDESLRQYLLGIGEYTDIESIPGERTTITFKDRFTAEKFMYGTSGGEIPSIGKVEMAWVQTPLPAVAFPKSNPIQNGDDDANVDDGDAMATGSPVRGIVDGQEDQQNQNLDYDVADDNDWAD